MRVKIEDGAANEDTTAELPIADDATRTEIITALAHHWKRKPADVIADDEGDDKDGRIVMSRGIVRIAIIR